MITKNNDAKLADEIVAQIVTDTAARFLKLGKFFPKSELKPGTDYYTYFKQQISIDEAIKTGQLGEIKPVAPGVSLQELNIRKPVSKSVSINMIGGVLNINQNLINNDIITVNDMLADVGSLIGNSLEKEIARVLFESSIPEFDNTGDLELPKFVIKAQEKFKEVAGDDVDLNLNLVNYKTITAYKELLYDNNKAVEEIEAIKKYFYTDNIDILGTAVADGGYRVPEDNYIGFDYRVPPVTLLYTKEPRTKTSIVEPEEGANDYDPLIMVKSKEVLDEIPEYTKYYIVAKYGVLENKLNKAIRGNLGSE
jgi:hypothetical protein